jgi:hypothetical protein
MRRDEKGKSERARERGSEGAGAGRRIFAEAIILNSY